MTSAFARSAPAAHPRRGLALGLATLFAWSVPVRADDAAQAPAPPVSRPDGELTRIERALGVIEGEQTRLDGSYQVVPDLFTSDDRGERDTWGEIYYLTKEYQRASMLLFGAVEPRESDATPVEKREAYADSLFYLADSLFLLGNHAPAKAYFEQLLKLRGHSHHEDALLRLMEMGDEVKHFDDVQRYYDQYVGIVGEKIPGKVRYLWGKTLFLAGKDNEAISAMRLIAPTDPYSLRARYLTGAALVREGKLDDALAAFAEIVAAPGVARDDKKVKEEANLACGRLFYELDRLDESIAAYQKIPYDSPLLTTMLYEVTWAYVRRGQLAARPRKDDKLTERERRELAKVEYEKALDQLNDLRALEPDSDRTAEVDILAGNLRLQRSEHDSADQIFGGLMDAYRDADAKMASLIAEHSSRERLLADIVEMTSGGLAADSALPSLVARRVVKNDGVVQALSVFRDIQASRDEIEDISRLLTTLEKQLAPDNPGRTELFKPLRSGIERSMSIDNTVLGLRQSVLAIERRVARVPAEGQARLKELAEARAALEERVASLPKTVDELAARKKRLLERVEGIDQALHRAELEARQRRAELNALDFMYARDTTSASDVVKVELRKNQLRQERGSVEAVERRLQELKGMLAELRKGVAAVGGRGSGDDVLRQEYARAFREEREALAVGRDPTQLRLYTRLDAVVARLEDVSQKNVGFRDRLDRAVEDRLAGVRKLLAAQREALASYTTVLGDIDTRAASLREHATSIALEKVRSELSRIVLRADVGVIDVAFARKQQETETISQAQRKSAEELTDLGQAYADLTQDEAP